MGIGIFDVFLRVHRLGRDMHPGFSLNSLKHQVILLGRTLIYLSEIKAWYEISDNPLLTLALKRFPLMSGAMYWPYINLNWNMKRRLGAIDQHFRMLGGKKAIIARATFEEIEVAHLNEQYPGLRLVLDKAIWFLREGEIVLNLFVNDQRFYSIAFSLGMDEGLPVIFVGALQGSNSEEAQDIYRAITHALHGMRPRDVLMTVLKLLCSEIDVNKILAISSENRQHNSPYFGKSHKDKVLVAYNEVWLEHGGAELEGGFYEIPTTVIYKDMSEIATRKRATYRRRYQMLDKLALDIKERCSSFGS